MNQSNVNQSNVSKALALLIDWVRNSPKSEYYTYKRRADIEIRYDVGASTDTTEGTCTARAWIYTEELYAGTHLTLDEVSKLFNDETEITPYLKKKQQDKDVVRFQALADKLKRGGFDLQELAGEHDD